MIADAARVVGPARPDGRRIVRGLSGMVAGGLVALAIAVCVAQWLSSMSGRPGPGMVIVAGHVAVALAAVGLQLAAERTLGRSPALASWSLLVLAASVLWFGWWA